MSKEVTEVKRILGIDISKDKFDVALPTEGKKDKHKVFSNNTKGYKELSKWLDKLGVKELHACMEATGIYWEGLAYYLDEKGYEVSVENPAKIKRFGESKLSRNKTDKADAKIIASYCAVMKPGLWRPEPIETRELRSMVRRLDALKSMVNQEQNRYKVASGTVKEGIGGHLEYLLEDIESLRAKIRKHVENNVELKEKKQLLLSINGVGEETAHVVLGSIGKVENFKNARHVASYLGIAPRNHSSGSSVKRPGRMSKMGPSSERKAFYMPAVVGINHNQVLMRLNERLSKAGKHKMVIIGAAMRKLVHIIYGVLKNGIPFDPNYELKRAKARSRNKFGMTKPLAQCG